MLFVVVTFPFIVAIGYPASSTLWVLLIAINNDVFDFMFCNAFYALRDAFKSMLIDPCLKRAILIMDTLDECIDKENARIGATPGLDLHYSHDISQCQMASVESK